MYENRKSPNDEKWFAESFGFWYQNFSGTGRSMVQESVLAGRLSHEESRVVARQENFLLMIPRNHQRAF